MLHCLLTCIVSNRKSDVILIFVLLFITSLSFLAAFMISSLSLGLNNLIMKCHCVFFLVLVIHTASWIWRIFIHQLYGYFFCTPSFPSGTLIIYNDCMVLSHSSLISLFIYLILFSLWVTLQIFSVAKPTRLVIIFSFAISN